MKSASGAVKGHASQSASHAGHVQDGKRTAQDSFRALQRAAGNGAMAGMFNPGQPPDGAPIPPGSAISQDLRRAQASRPGSSVEREADRLGERILSAPGAEQAFPSANGPLTPAARAFFERRLGADLSGVRLHADVNAADSSRALEARAWTRGSDIYFAKGANAPTQEGRQLLAHELVHVVQGGVRAHSSPVQEHAAAGAVMCKTEGAAEAPADVEPEWKPLNRMYAIVFPADLFEKKALEFIRKYHPRHKLLRPTNFEDMFSLLRADVEAEQKKGNRLHIDQIMLVSHAVREGGLMVPFRRKDVGKKDRFFSPESFYEIQRKILEKAAADNRADQKEADALEKFGEDRHFVVTNAIDENTTIIVRGCNFGVNPNAPDALRLFFGGAATVWAAEVYQVYGNDATGKISSYYVRTKQDKEKLIELEMKGQKFSKEAEALRIRELSEGLDQKGEPLVTPSDVGVSDESVPAGDHWTRNSGLYQDVPLKEIEDRARILLKDYKPQNATQLRTLRKAWMEHSEHLEQIISDTSGDPLASSKGALEAPQEIFGDPEVIDRDAEQFPNSNDRFLEVEYLPPQRPEEEAKKAQDFTDSQEMGNTAHAAQELDKREKAALKKPAVQPGDAQKGKPGVVREGAGFVIFPAAHITGTVPGADDSGPAPQPAGDTDAAKKPEAADQAPAPQGAGKPDAGASAPQSTKADENPSAGQAAAPKSSGKSPATSHGATQKPAGKPAKPGPKVTPGHVDFPDQQIQAKPPAAFEKPPAEDRPPFNIGLEGEASKAKEPLVVIPKGKWQRTFGIPIAKKAWLLKNVEAEITFDGSVEYKQAGEKTATLSGLRKLATKTGEKTESTGGSFEGTIFKEKDQQGRFISAKAGAEGSVMGKTKEVEGDPMKGAGQKFELYGSFEAGWGPVSGEVKVTLVGYDSTKSGSDKVKILEIKVSPLIVTGTYSIPCSDGDSVDFTGKISFGIKAEPDWAEIGKRVAQFLGRDVAVEAAAVSGTGAAAGAGTGEFALDTGTAIGAGEGIIALGFVAVAAATVFALVESIEDIDNLQELQKTAHKGVEEFVTGFLVGIGRKTGSDSGSGLYNLGFQYGNDELERAFQRSKKRLREKYGLEMTAEEEHDMRFDQKLRVQTLPDVERQVWGAFEKPIRKQFYKAFKKRLGSRYDTPAGDMQMRSAAGVGLDDDVESAEPNWQYIYSIFGSVPKAPPGHY